MKRYVITGADKELVDEAFKTIFDHTVATHGEEAVYTIDDMQAYVSDHWECDLIAKLGRNGDEKSPENIAAYALKLLEETEDQIPEYKQVVIFKGGFGDIARAFMDNGTRIPENLVDRIISPQYDKVFMIGNEPDDRLSNLYSQNRIEHISPDSLESISYSIGQRDQGS